MKDLRKEIQERLTEIESQRASLQKQLNSINMKENSLKVLLEAEDERWTEQLSLDSVITSKSNGKHTPLYAFILSVLAKGAMSKNEILEEALKANIPFTGKRPKVAVHFTLLGMMNAQAVQKSGDLWSLKGKDAQSIK